MRPQFRCVSRPEETPEPASGCAAGVCPERTRDRQIAKRLETMMRRPTLFLLAGVVALLAATPTIAQAPPARAPAPMKPAPAPPAPPPPAAKPYKAVAVTIPTVARDATFDA